jgi:hypothetical protein
MKLLNNKSLGPVQPGQIWCHKRLKHVLIFILSVNKKETNVFNFLALKSLKISNCHIATITQYYELVK